MLKQLLRLYFNLLAKLHINKVLWVEDLPNKPQKHTFYIVGGREFPFQFTFVCPRRQCNQLISLDISPEITPRWKITEHSKGSISIHPSVHVVSLRCKCHYWVRKGKIHWAETPTFLIPKENKLDPQSHN